MLRWLVCAGVICLSATWPAGADTQPHQRSALNPPVWHASAGYHPPPPLLIAQSDPSETVGDETGPEAAAGNEPPAAETEPGEAAGGDTTAAETETEPTAGGDASAAQAGPDESAGEEAGEAAEEAPVDGGPLSVRIDEIQIDGNTVIATPVLQEKVKPYQGRALTLEEMGEVADLVTITYQEKGYILARAYLPEQEIDSGTLTIAVQEGKVGKLIVTGGRHFDERVIKRYYNPQLEHGAIKESLLEKGLLFSSEIPRVKTDIVLKEGEQPGEVDVVINTQETSEVTFGLNASIDYNNFGSAVVSEDRYGVNLQVIDHNWGSELKVRGVTGNTYEDSTLTTLNLSVPVNNRGTKLVLNYLTGNYVVGQEYADLGFAGKTENRGARVVHPFLKKKNMNADVELGYEHKYAEQEQLGELSHIDELDGGYIGVNFDNLDRFLGKNIASLQYYYGNFHPDDDFTPSRDRLDDPFQRITFNVARIQKIYGYSNALLRASAQYSPDRLPSSEQAILGGYGSVRGHAPSQYLGDSGYNVSAELMFAPPFIADKNLFGQRLAQMVQFALFYEHGGVFNNDAEPGETDTETLSGFGGGVRFFYKDKFTFKYDIGFPVDQVEGQPDHYNYFTGSLTLF